VKRYAVALTFLLVVSGCSGSSDTATPATTVAPTTTATVAPTSTVASLSVDPQLDLAFAIAVEDFIATNWAGWSEGESLGRCLAANAADIDAPAKQGVIDYGLDEVYAHISRTDGYSLGSVWGYCEEQVASGTSESGTADQSDESTAGTTTPTPTTTAPPESMTTEPVGLTVTCTLDVARAEISCQASSYQQGSQLTWTSTASWANSNGGQWDFTILEELFAPTAEVLLEECQGSNCRTVEISIDTSILGPPPSTTTTGMTDLPPSTTTTTTIDPTTPPSLVLVLPFEIADNYDEAGTAYGALSFAGESPISAFGGGSPDLWTVPWAPTPELFINLVPGTTVHASVAGLIDIVAVQNLYHEDPEGIYTNDFELMIYPEVPEGTNRVLINYDHVVNLQVVDGQWVEQGDPIGTGVPMRLMSGAEQPFDFFEWGVKKSRYNWPGRTTEGPQAYCPEPFLIPEHQQFIQDVLVQMALEGFPSGPSICLTDTFADDGTSDWRTSWETTEEPEELSVACTLNSAYRQVGCNAIGSTEGSRLLWESNIYGGYEGPWYAARLENESQFVPEAIVTLTECQGSVCETVETSIDTSMLVFD
jgi:hypothetical protein